MAVAVDTVATANESNVTVSTLDISTATVGSGSNRALVVQIGFDLSTITSVTVVWDPAGANQALAKITETNIDASFGRFQLWGLVNPTTGSGKIIRASWTTASAVAIGGVSFTGVDQTGGSTSFVAATPTNGNGTSPAITVTSAAGNYAMDIVGPQNSISAQTQTLNTGAGGAGWPNVNMGGSYAAGSASVVFGWTCSTGLWVECGVNIVAAGGGGGPTVAQYQNSLDAQRASGGPPLLSANWWM